METTCIFQQASNLPLFSENNRRLGTTEDEAFHDFYSLVNGLIISMTKPRTIRRAGHVTNVGS